MNADELPDCDDVFLRFFDRWYRDVDRQARVFSATRPDAEGIGSAGFRAADVSRLTPEGWQRVSRQIETIVEAARQDWPTFLSVSGTLSVGWLDAFDRHFDVAAVHDLLECSDPEEYSNELLVLACELGGVLGTLMIERNPTLEWLGDWPYWESAVYDATSGYRVNVFHWAIKKFSGYGVDDGYAAKLLATLDLIERGWAS